MKKYNVAVVGANGAVGEEILTILSEINFPLNKLVPLASARSVGKTVTYNNQDIDIVELTEDVFAKEEIEIALFSAGGSVSAKFAPDAVKAGAVVIDNTSHFRMMDDVPLVVPEVNPQDITKWKQTGIIANPNCSTIQMVQTLKPLDDAYDLVRVDVSTYQATSGAGKTAMEELVNQMQDFFAFKLSDSEHKCFNQQIALNVICVVGMTTAFFAATVALVITAPGYLTVPLEVAVLSKSTCKAASVNSVAPCTISSVMCDINSASLSKSKDS